MPTTHSAAVTAVGPCTEQRLGRCGHLTKSVVLTAVLWPRVHWLNTWVGAVVGAVPPLMGWAAARGALEPAAGVLAAALYFWQMPHFMALAYMGKDDYIRGGYRMLSHPMYDPTGQGLPDTLNPKP